MKRTLKVNALYRHEVLALERKAPEGDGPARYRMSFSSEYPVQRWFGTETLKHTSHAVDLSRAKLGMSVRDTHYGDVVGIADNPAVEEDGKLRGDVTFSSNPRAQEIERDVVAGIRRFVSIRYIPIRARLTEKGSGGAADKYEVTRWQPIHVAFEPDPADPTVGPERSANDEMFAVEIEGGDPAQEVRSMPCEKCKQTHEGACPSARSAGDGSPATPPTGAPAPAAAADRSANGNATATAVVIDDKSRRREIAEIVRLCQAHGQSERAPDFIERGLDAGAVSLEILKGRRTEGGGAPPSERNDKPPRMLDLGKDAARYSYRRAILAMDSGSLDGLEKEAHDEIAKNLPQSYKSRSGVFVPMALRHERDPEEILQRAISSYFDRRERALDSKTGTAAAELVFDQPGGLIELLRNNTVLLRSGARLLTGLTAPIAFVKQSGAGTAYWVGENPGVDVTESNLTTGIVTLAPKTLQATTAFSRQLLQLSSEDAERMVREDMAAIHAIAIDKAGYHGLGSAGQPMGIYYAPDVIAKAMGGGADWTKIVDMVAQCADKNALDGTLGWVAQTLLAGRYMTIPKIASAAAGFLWEGTVQEGTMAGYVARSTSQLSKVMSGSDPTGGSSYGLVFGNWSDMIIGMWGALEMIPDPYAKKKQGLIELTTFQMTDVLLRHGESFVKATGATLA